MRCISWNVNGIRAALKKGFVDYFRDINADIFCIQETKLQEAQMLELLEKDTDFAQALNDYHAYWHYAERKGYSGTAIFVKDEPQNVRFGIGESLFDCEGRVITLEYPDLFVVTVYSPNARDGLARIDYRITFEDRFRDYLSELRDTGRTVIVCGDMNVAHQEIDLKRPKENIGNPGFSFEERGKFSELLDSGFTDTFRYLHPEAINSYSWWSYRARARENNVGWRIDYWLISTANRNRVKEAYILSDVFGSDHCPVGIELK